MVGRISTPSLLLLLAVFTGQSSATNEGSLVAVFGQKSDNCSKYIDTTARMVCEMGLGLSQLEKNVQKTITKLEKKVQKSMDKLEKDVRKDTSGVQKDVAALRKDIHPTVSKCPPGFNSTASGCYRLITYRLNRSKAARKCHSIHPKAHLVSIDNKAEYDFVNKLISAKPLDACSHAGRQAYWTSAQWIDPDLDLPTHDTSTPFVWRTSTPDYWVETVSEMTYNAWGPGFPDNEWGHCACALFMGGTGLRDEQCNQQYCSVCELDVEH